MNFALLDDMRAVPDIIRNFDPHCVAAWREHIQQTKKLFLTGEGSSRILPAHNLITRAMQQGTDWQIQTEGARQATDYNLTDYTVIGGSNSGRTREVLALFTQLHNQNKLAYAVTATPDSLISTLAAATHLLQCGPEQAVAATKSVVEQTLVYQSLLAGPEWAHQQLAADHCTTLLNDVIPSTMIDTVAKASCLYFTGRNDGVAQELALKASEITRKPSVYLEGTSLLHGIEEIMQSTDVVIIVEPFAADSDKINSVLHQGIGTTIIAIAHTDTAFPTIRIPQLAGFDVYFQLLAGWNLLVHAAWPTALISITPNAPVKLVMRKNQTAKIYILLFYCHPTLDSSPARRHLAKQSSRFVRHRDVSHPAACMR